MTLKIASTAATNELIASLARTKKRPRDTCLIANAVDTVFNGEKCLTYQYILITALTAKATDQSVDMLSLQIDDPSDGAYAPRSLCKEVVYPFQKNMLGNAMDGANNDPLVNKPARFLRLSKDNQARGDGKRALYALCDSLPLIKTQDDARACLDYVMTRLLRVSKEKQQQHDAIANAVRSSSATDLRKFLSDLLDQGFGGDALVLTVSALYRIQYPEAEGYKVIPHPVNQPGTSSRQLSDLDLEKDGVPFLGTELKDKPFTVDDVRRAATTAAEGNVSGVLFVSGRGGNLNDQTQAYFATVRQEFARRGVYVGICDVDALMDIVLATHHEIDAAEVLQGVYDQVCENAGTPETQMWVYSHLISLLK